jgi:hypothetical protein
MAKAKVRSAMDGMGNAVRIVETSPRLDASVRLETSRVDAGSGVNRYSWICNLRIALLRIPK